MKVFETIESPKAAPTPEAPAAPIPMIMNCPACGVRHIDEGRFATHPHTTHSCQSCGVNFKPALVPTVGVEFLPGYQNQEGIVAEARKLRGLLSDLVSVVRCREDTGPALLAAELHLKKTDGMPDLQEIELYFNPRGRLNLDKLTEEIVKVVSRGGLNPADEMDARFNVRDLLTKHGRS